jgi:hypothetical protein
VSFGRTIRHAACGEHGDAVASSGDGTKWEQQQDRASVNANISVFAEFLSKYVHGVDQNVA